MPNITIEKATPSNPATLLAPSEAIPDSHDCVEIGTSAQQAELIALAKACELAENKTANIYTDSHYAFGAVHDFRAGWQQKGFLTSAGLQVEELLKALQLPKQVAVLKVKAHLRGGSSEVKGNTLADQAAAAAAARAAEAPTAQTCHLRVTHYSQLKDIAEMQDQCSREEKWEWIENDCKLADDKIWKFQQQILAPKALIPYLATQIHSVGHLGVFQMCSHFNTIWWARGFRKHAEEVVRGCVTCQKHNSAPPIPSVASRTPAPSGPFRELQCDFITLPKCKDYQDVITGRPMSLPGTPDLAEADVHLISDSLLTYCMALTEAKQV
ncbi:hypothetical protein H4Q32_030171 [Labeo rohita]|uniref:RNase H type-1 domain-containing protein n=1 Tax=Labeo rohita TaxID=84645 RepID=A0ABQ8MDZ9_LABRO|nr:hypothetical protein H4Q32_030171 [Labeo rohita]